MELSTRMVRDRDAQELVAKIAALGQPSLPERGVAAARAYVEDHAAAGPAGPEVGDVEDLKIAARGRAIPVRVYRPAVAGPAPVVVYLHGGGWVVGSVSASDAFCRRLVVAAGCVLVSVEYRLAPEHPHPAAVDDAFDAIAWVHENLATWDGDPDRLVVLGDSAGGNLATVAVGRHAAAGTDVRVSRQILAYPGTAADRLSDGGRYGEEWPLQDVERDWFLALYAPVAAMRADPDVAPLLAEVGGLPPTTLLLSGCDPLFAEGMAYAEHLWSHEVSVDLHVFAGQIHGVLTFDPSFLARSSEVLGVVANAIRHS